MSTAKKDDKPAEDDKKGSASERINLQHIMELREIFDHADADGGGDLALDEFIDAFKDIIGKNMTPKELKETYRSVLMSEDGEKVMEDLGARFGLWKSSFTPNSDETAFREGQRDVVLFLTNIIKDQPPKE